MAYEETTISSSIVYEGPVFRIRKHVVNTVDGGESVRDIVEHTGGAIMLAVSEDGKILMESGYFKTLR